MDPTGAQLPANFENGGWEYRFHRRIGRGGFGAVYEVEREKDGGRQRVAIKVLDAGGNAGAARGRFQDELTLLLRLDHPAFPRVYELVTVGGREAVVMELVSGCSLADFDDRALPESVVAEIGAEVACALHDAWEFVPRGEVEPLRLLHRDLKPPNLMVERTGRVRVLDLGAARSAPEYRGVETRRDGLVPVTPAYVPPEVVHSVLEHGWSGRIAPAPAEDVYSLGATLLALATGASYPNEIGRSWKAHARICTGYSGFALQPVLAGMLSREPETRPSMAEVEIQLRAVARSLGGPSIREWTERGFPHTPPVELRSAEPLPARPPPIVDQPDSLSAASHPARAPSTGPSLVPVPPRPKPAPDRTLPILALSISGLGTVALVAFVALLWWAGVFGRDGGTTEPRAATTENGAAAGATASAVPVVIEAAESGAAVAPIGAITGDDEAALPEKSAEDRVKPPEQRRDDFPADPLPVTPPVAPPSDKPVTAPTKPDPDPRVGAATGIVVAEPSAKCSILIDGKSLVPRAETVIPAGTVTAQCVWENTQTDGSTHVIERVATFDLAVGESKQVRCRRETGLCAAQ